MKHLRRFTRQQWQAVALLVVCVLVSGAALRFQADPPRSQLVPGKVGQELTLGPTQHVKVDGYESATTIIRDDSTYGRTDQVFIVVTFSFWTSRRESILVNTSLVLDGRAYEAQEDSFPMPPSGYAITHQAAFEVPRDALEGAEIHFVDRGVVTSYERELVIDLGIDEAKAAVLLDEARQKRVDIARAKEVPQ